MSDYDDAVTSQSAMIWGTLRSVEVDLPTVLAGSLILLSVFVNSDTVLDQMAYTFMLVVPPLVGTQVMTHNGWTTWNEVYDYCYNSSSEDNTLPWFFEVVFLATLFGYVIKIPQLLRASVRLGLAVVSIRQLSSWNWIHHDVIQQLSTDPLQWRPSVPDFLWIYIILYALVLQPSFLTKIQRWFHTWIHSILLLPYQQNRQKQRVKKELDVVVECFGEDAGLQIWSYRTEAECIDQRDREIRAAFVSQPCSTNPSYDDGAAADPFVAIVFRYWSELPNQPGQTYLEGIIVKNIIDLLFTKPTVFDHVKAHGNFPIVEKHWRWIVPFLKHPDAMSWFTHHLEERLKGVQQGDGVETEQERKDATR